MKAIVTAVLLMASGFVIAQESGESSDRWSRVGKTSGGFEFALDRESMRATEIGMRVWMRMSTPDGTTELMLYDLDCYKNMFRQLENYRIKKGSSTSERVPIVRSEWSSILPGSLLEEVSEPICSGREEGLRSD